MKSRRKRTEIFNEMKFLFLNIFVKILFAVYCQSTNENKVIKSILNGLSIKHCILIGKHTQDIRTLRYYADKSIYTTCMDVNFFIFYLKNGEYLNAKTAVVIKTDGMIEIFTDIKNEGTKNNNSELISDYVLSSFTWILFEEPLNPLRFQINEYYIPYNCELFIITPINETYYKIGDTYNIGLNKNTRRKCHDLGYWSQGQLLMTSEAKEKRRVDMLGEKVTFLAPFEEKYFKNDSFSYECLLSRFSECSFIIILLSIAEMTNSTAKFHSVFNATEEVLLKSNAITGTVMGDTTNPIGKFWLGPILSLQGYFFIKNNVDEEYRMSAYLAPFSKNVWRQIFFCLLASSITSFIIERKTRNSIVSLGAAFRSLETLCNQGGSGTSKSTSLRLVWLSIQISASILVPLYSAFIISYLTISTPKLPFTDLKTFVQAGTYKVSGIKGTYSHSFLKNSFEVFNNGITSNLLLNDTPSLESKASDWICNAKFKYAFVWYFDMRNADCEILKIPKPVFSIQLGISMMRFSPHLEAYKINFHRFNSNGLIHRMQKIDEERDKKLVFDKEYYVPITLKQILLLIYVISIGCLMTFIWLILEILWKRQKYLKKY